MRVIVAGSRTITDYYLVATTIQNCPWPITTMITGRCRDGVDALAEQYAREFNIANDQYPANWKLYGKAAGPIRNELMASKGEALLAIWDGQSTGTANMIQQAETKGLKTCVIRTDIVPIKL